MSKHLTIIRIPRTPPSAFNQHRPVSDLVKAQVRHAHQELQRWWEERGNIDPEHIKTEQEAADYVRMVTRVLHPEGASQGRLPSDRAPKSGVWLGPTKRAKKTTSPASRRKATSKKRFARPKGRH
jgi:hypothetical protein